MTNRVKDQRLAPLFDRIRARAVSTLGSMVACDNAAFFTATDVASRMITALGVDLTTIDRDDLNEVIAATSLALSTSYSRNLDQVRRTTKRISPRCSTGRAAYGYRVGMAIRTDIPDVENMRRNAENTSAYEKLDKHKNEMAERLVGMMNYRELCQLELSVQARKERLYSDMERQLFSDKTRPEELSDPRRNTQES
tara:strand:+ start:137047 stop:137634 length:588 start_codon:yes stop_codon:yes gene_type:complete